jgi:hypothetical protein
MTGTNFSDWYNASEGAFSCSFDFAVDTARFPMSVSDGTNNNRMQLMCWSSRQGQIVSGGSDQALFDNGTVTVGAVTTVAMAYKANSAALSLNGAVASTDATVSVPTVDRLYFGNATSGGDVINGHVRELLYWPQRITNNEVRAFAV